MGRSKGLRAPSYRRHQRGNAIVWIAGREYSLGTYGSSESREKYERLIAEWIAAGRPRPWLGPANSRRNSVNSLSVGELLLRYLDHAEGYYRKNGEPTSEITTLRKALSFVVPLYSHLAAADFGPIALKLVRDRMVRSGLSRPTVNSYVARVKRMFRWAVEDELVPGSIYHALQAVQGLRRGRTEAPDPDPIQPVSEEHVRAVLPHVTRTVRAMIELQLLTGMRPGEVIRMRATDLITTEHVWVYQVSGHKTEHHGKVRRVFVGPKAQDVLRPFLREGISGYLFSPEKIVEEARAVRRAARKSRMTPSQAARTRKEDPKRPPGDVYTRPAYTRAIARACKLAKVPHWSPNQLRHTAATRIRSLHGIEMARIILGHSSAVTSEIYAEIDEEKAVAVVERCG